MAQADKCYRRKWIFTRAEKNIQQQQDAMRLDAILTEQTRLLPQEHY